VREMNASHSLGLNERVGNLLMAIHRRNNQNSRATADHQSQGPRFLRKPERIIRITQELGGVIEHQVQERIIAFQNAAGFTASLKLDANRLVKIATQIDDGFLLLLFGLHRRAAISAAATRLIGALIAVLMRHNENVEL